MPTAAIRSALMDALRRAGGTIVTDAFHTFGPHGVSGVIVIADSHATIHTWSEQGYAAVDVFSCDVSLDHGLISKTVKSVLGAESVVQQSHPRGAALALS